MSKFRRNNVYSSPRNRNKSCANPIDDIAMNGKLKLNKKKLMSHGEFWNRVQKSFYYGGGKAKMSIPLSDYIADTFSDTHNGYSLNRLNYSTVGNLHSTPCSLILALIYLERLKDADPAYTKHVTPTELFLVSMMVATKFYSGHDDEAPYVNWAECANTTADNLLQMELAFLTAIDWKVYVSNEEFFGKVISLEMTLALRQGSHRGFTYMELNSLIPSVQIAKQFIQSIVVMGLSYAILVATMVASVFLVSQIPGTHFNTSSRPSGTASQTGVSQTLPTCQPQLENTNVVLSSEQIETAQISTGYENVLLGLELDNRNETSTPLTSKRNTSTTWDPLSLSSWYSMFKIDFIKWPVIKDSLDLDLEHICDDANLMCNYSTHFGQFAPTTKFDRFNFDFTEIKMRCA